MKKKTKIKFILENWKDEKQTAYFCRWMAKKRKIISGSEMFFLGAGTALVTYTIGLLIGVSV